MQLFINSTWSKAQSNFYDLNTLQKIEINFAQSNWDYQLDSAKQGAQSYILAASVTINGSTYDSVGVKYKGNSSYDSTYTKNPLHIALDEFKSQSYQGFTDIKLGNGYADPSQIREVLSYSILQNYMDCPHSNFAQVYINGIYYGVYSNDESINKDFCSEHFYSSANTLIKCNPTVIPGPTTKSNLKFKAGQDSSSYFNFYEIKSAIGWNDLVVLCDSVTNHPSSLSAVLDLDRVIWMLAFNNVMVNLDSYSGVFCQNYYLYKDNTNHFNPIIWDLNMSLGGFPFAGSGATGMGSLSVLNMKQLPLALHSADSYWPLIKAILNNASYKKMYVAHMRTIVNEFFASNLYLATASSLQALIDTAVLADTNGFYNYLQFQSGLTTDYVVGSYTVPGIGNLMNARTNFLQATAEFMASPPLIYNVSNNPSLPNLNSTVTITSQISKLYGGTVSLGYRNLNSDKFNRVQMYDDGLHNDGAAGDTVYGASLLIQGASMQYYIYAENATASTFSPERAEHEFYNLQALIQTPNQGQVVVNEFLANNVNDETDENGNHSDWVELYNTTSDTLSLSGMYLSDSYTNPQKFAFPSNSIILPTNYLMIWADDKIGTSALHCNFKLSQNGERLMLSTADSLVLDSITYGPQTADISIGHCPDGNGAMGSLSSTSFNAPNCANGWKENTSARSEVYSYPNPASTELVICINANTLNQSISIENIVGQTIYKKPAQKLAKIDVTPWKNGIYVLHFNNLIQKIVIQK